MAKLKNKKENILKSLTELVETESPSHGWLASVKAHVHKIAEGDAGGKGYLEQIDKLIEVDRFPGNIHKEIKSILVWLIDDIKKDVVNIPNPDPLGVPSG